MKRRLFTPLFMPRPARARAVTADADGLVRIAPTAMLGGIPESCRDSRESPGPSRGISAEAAAAEPARSPRRLSAFLQARIPWTFWGGRA